jgi:hypothetical protein
MLVTLAIVLFVAWIVGQALFQLAGTLIRVLIVLSLVTLILRMVWGGSARSNLRRSRSPARRPARAW